MDLLLCELEGLRCALPASDVREVIRAVTILPLAGASQTVEGVINVRGDSVPMLNLRSRLHLEARPVGVTEHFVLLRTGERQIGVRVDRALAVITVPDGDIDAISQAMSGTDGIPGVGTLPDGTVLVQDVNRLLDDSEQPPVADSLARSPGAGAA